MTSESTIAKACAEHRFLQGLSDRLVAVLVSGAQPFTFEPGEYLAKTNKKADRFLLIQEGHVELVLPTPHRGDVPIQTVGPGDVIGWSWLVPPNLWSFDCRALDEVKAIGFDADWLEAQCEGDHELGYFLLKQLIEVIANRLEASRVQLLDIYE